MCENKHCGAQCTEQKYHFLFVCNIKLQYVSGNARQQCIIHAKAIKIASCLFSYVDGGAC